MEKLSSQKSQCTGVVTVTVRVTVRVTLTVCLYDPGILQRHSPDLADTALQCGVVSVLPLEMSPPQFPGQEKCMQKGFTLYQQ